MESSMLRGHCAIAYSCKYYTKQMHNNARLRIERRDERVEAKTLVYM